MYFAPGFSFKDDLIKFLQILDKPLIIKKAKIGRPCGVFFELA